MSISGNTPGNVHTHVHTLGIEDRKLLIIATPQKHMQAHTHTHTDSLTDTPIYSLFIMVTLTVGGCRTHTLIPQSQTENDKGGWILATKRLKVSQGTQHIDLTLSLFHLNSALK